MMSESARGVRLSPDLVNALPTRGGKEPLRENVSIMHILAKERFSYGRDFRFDITDLSIVRRLAEAYGENRPIPSPAAEPEFPLAVFFAGDTANCGLILGFDYDPIGIVREGDQGHLYRATNDFKHTLNAAIEGRRAVFEVRDGFCDALLNGDWPSLRHRSNSRLAVRARKEVLFLVEQAGLDFSRCRVVSWRDLPSRGRLTRQHRGPGLRRLAGFVGRLKPGQTGPSCWLEVLLEQTEEDWRVTDFSISTSGCRRVFRQRFQSAVRRAGAQK